ncbi:MULTISPECIES: GntR family transcriptional regulator [unclassified Flagellimonas]|uniref:GntR family transcriptional regulator n=1 Tax=unclassified Flagellimonas TaxID=2644544 RepID=UPI0013D55F44|nr:MULTISPECIES: GntR family transcriptional regulator [unclassified Flagellimonas]
MNSLSILRNQVKSHLLEQIQMGELEVGKTINLARLSRTMGISVTPIREALSQLEQARIIKAVPNRGFVIFELSKAEAKNLYETISQLELMALENSSFTPEFIQVLRLHQTRLKQANTDSGKLKERFEFHRALISRCANIILIQLLEDLKARLLFYEQGFGKHEASFYENVNNQNEALIQAIEDDNIPTAALILKMNWMFVLKHIENQIDE